jgi:hypothetical protein
LKNAGGTVLGYVATDYGDGSKTESDIISEINVWQTLYPEIEGIFLDEMAWLENISTDTGLLADLYARFTAHAKSIDLNFVVGNPGTSATDYMLSKNMADTLVVFENILTALDIEDLQGITAGFEHYLNYENGTRAALIYDADSVDVSDTELREVVESTGLIYFTDDEAPNPWDALTTYGSRLFTAIQVQLYKLGLFSISLIPSLKCKLFGITLENRRVEKFENVSLSFTVETLELYTEYTYSCKLQYLSLAEKQSVCEFIKINKGIKIAIPKLFFFDYEGGEEFGNEINCLIDYGDMRTTKMSNGLWNIELKLKTREVA